MIPITPIERELVYKHAPLPPRERALWCRLMEGEGVESKRVGMVRMLHRILERGEKEAEFGQGLVGLLKEEKGVLNRREALDRLDTLYTLAGLPEEVGVKGWDALGVVRAAEHKARLRSLLTDRLRTILPVKELGEVGSRALSNTEYLANLFKYQAGYRADRNHLEIFQMIHQAFLERGVAGVKELKYHSKHFQSALEDERMRGFAERLDEAVGHVTSGGGKLDLWESYKGKIQDFEGHASEENLHKAVGEARQRVEALKRKAEPHLKELGGDLAKSLHDLLAKSDYEGLGRALDQLQRTKLTGKAERARNFLLGQLRQLTALGRLSQSDETIRVGREIVDRLRELEGKPFSEQLDVLNEARERYGREKLEKHAAALAALGKQSGKDLSFFISQVLEPPMPSREGVTARFTHDATHLFTLGKFENNCQSPGVAHSQSLLGYTVHPSELTLAFHTPDGEYAGFSFGHFLRHAKDPKRYTLYFERPYATHQELKPAMSQAIGEIKKRVERLAEKEGIALSVHTAETFPKGEHHILPSPFVTKWYDMTHGAGLEGSVRGGETV